MLRYNDSLQPLREVLRLLQQQAEPRGWIRIDASIDDAYRHRPHLWAVSAFDSTFDDEAHLVTPG